MRRVPLIKQNYKKSTYYCNYYVKFKTIISQIQFFVLLMFAYPKYSNHTWHLRDWITDQRGRIRTANLLWLKKQTNRFYLFKEKPFPMGTIVKNRSIWNDNKKNRFIGTIKSIVPEKNDKKSFQRNVMIQLLLTNRKNRICNVVVSFS